MASDLKSWLEAYAAVSREWMTQEKKKLPVKPAYGYLKLYHDIPLFSMRLIHWI